MQPIHHERACAARDGDPSGASAPARALALVAVSGLLAGCGMVVMDPSGDVAVQQRNLIIASTALMLLVIVPVIALTFMFAWRYRASNTDATYDPDWHHSTQLEVVIWTVPLLIIIALGAMTWISTHTLDPFRPLSRLAPNQPVPGRREAADGRGRRARLEMAVHLSRARRRERERDGRARSNVPIAFRITSSSVWNTFYVPALAGMIYAMPGMETKLHAVMNKEGDFTGLSGHVQRIGLLPHELRLPQPRPAGLRRVGGEGEGRRNAARPRGLPQAREAERSGAGPAISQRWRAASSTPSSACASRRARCACTRCTTSTGWAAAAKDSEANRKRLDYDNRRLESGDEPSGRHLPGLRPPAEESEASRKG